MNKLVLVTASIVFLTASSAFSAPINWTSWTIGGSGATGTVTQNGTAIDVTYVGHALSTDKSNWGEGSPAPYTGSSVVDNAPTSGISLKDISTKNTLTFGQNLIDPVFALYSVGSGSIPVDYIFDQPFTLISQGEGHWGGSATSFSVSGNTLTGEEGNGVVQFAGSISSISWDNAPAEFHHGFTLGAIDEIAPVPEPSTFLLLGSGLAGLGFYARKRKKA